MKIITKFQLLVTLAMLAASISSTILTFYTSKKSVENEFRSRVHALALSLRMSSEEAIWKNRKFLIQDFVNDIQEQPDASYTFVVEPDGLVVAHSDPRKIRTNLSEVANRPPPALEVLKGGEIYQYALPLQGGKLGYAVVAASTHTIRREIRKLAASFAAAEAVILAVLLWAAATLTKKLLHPIQILGRGMVSVGHGDLEHRLSESGQDELAQLTRRFNAMVTSLKQAQEDLQKAQRQITQAARLAALGQLGASVAHEINNPLSGIIGLCQVMMEEMAEVPALEVCKPELDHILRECARCKTVVESLLRFSRAPADEAVQPVDPGRLLGEVLSTLRYSLEAKEIVLRSSVESDLPAFPAMPSRLQHVFLSLVLRAERSLSRGGTLEVAAHPSLQPGRPGVEIVFMASHPEGLSNLEEGTEEGLGISKEIIREHGGEIREEGGNRYTVFLPLSSTHAK